IGKYTVKETWNNSMQTHQFKDISLGLKAAATALCNPTIKGTPITRVDTHSQCSGGANALSLLGYVDR
ncbi:hypothetical protein ACHAXS_002761, partial [Conticribra weissflogii]